MKAIRDSYRTITLVDVTGAAIFLLCKKFERSEYELLTSYIQCVKNTIGLLYED